MIQTLFAGLIGVAAGFAFPALPAVPDLIETGESFLHGNFTPKTVEEPTVLLPTVEEIDQMTHSEKSERFHWFLFVFVVVFVGVVTLGSVIMILGPELKALTRYQPLEGHVPLSKTAQLGLVCLSFGVTFSLSLAACWWSLATGRLSKTTGLDWELYVFLFCCVGCWLIIQAILAVSWLPAGNRFDATAFGVAAFTSMAPFLSDLFDTMKDVIFASLCIQSEHWSLMLVGVVSLIYLVLFHGWFIFASAANARNDIPGAHCSNELAASHLAVLLSPPKVEGEASLGFWEGIVLPMIFQQLTRSKRTSLLIENIPQAVFSVLFLWLEGGSFFVTAFSLVAPGVQIALGFLLFPVVVRAAAPAVAKKLNKAMQTSNGIAARALTAEAEGGSTDGIPHQTICNKWGNATHVLNLIIISSFFSNARGKS